MTHVEWSAADYANGSYIQSKIAEPYLHELILKPRDNILDIGCGDGRFTSRIANQIPYGQILGIDSSSNMVQLAEKYQAIHPNFSVREGDVMNMNFRAEFDCVLSFWCLHWSEDIIISFNNIYQALKKDGILLVLCPTGEGGPYSRAYRTVKESRHFDELTYFTIPPGYNNFTKLPQKLAALPFSKLLCERIVASIVLPSLDVFSDYVQGMAHFQNQFPLSRIKKINEAMVEAYVQYCQQHYQGKYLFELAIYKISGVK